MERRAHWEAVHRESGAGEVSWYLDEPRVSLRMLDRAGAGPASRVLDVGCGASGLAGALLARGWRDVTALDVSAAAIARAKERLGKGAERVAWVESDVLAFEPARAFDVWHDRATLHFLTQPAEQRRYAEVAARAVAPGGHVILAAFALDGPDQCSGLPVQRHDAGSLGRVLGPRFRLVAEEKEDHVTPWKKVQRFQWALFRG